MTDEIKKLKAYRDAVFAELVPIPVPEIDSTWYTSTKVMLRDYKRIRAVQGDVDRALETVLVLAKDANGKRLFTDANRADLETQPPQLIGRIADEIFGHVNTPTPEEAEKKS